MSELKPCPFCGSDPATFNQTGLIICSYSMCGVNPISYSDVDWNNRKQPTVRDYIKANESDWKKCHRKMVNISSLYEFIGECEK
mgnify:CR=1 FL=1